MRSRGVKGEYVQTAQDGYTRCNGDRSNPVEVRAVNYDTSLDWIMKADTVSAFIPPISIFTYVGHHIQQAGGPVATASNGGHGV